MAWTVGWEILKATASAVPVSLIASVMSASSMDDVECKTQ